MVSKVDEWNTNLTDFQRSVIAGIRTRPDFGSEIVLHHTPDEVNHKRRPVPFLWRTRDGSLTLMRIGLKIVLREVTVPPALPGESGEQPH